MLVVPAGRAGQDQSAEPDRQSAIFSSRSLFPPTRPGLTIASQAVTPRPSPLSLYLSETVLAKHVHAVALSLARYFPALLPYHAWFMWTFREQPGPVSWRVFLRGVWERVTGRYRSDSVWPRVEGLRALDAERQRQEAEQGALVRPPSPALSEDVGPSPSTADRPTSPPFRPLDDAEHTPPAELAIKSLPTDLLTPPYTPPALSPSVSSTRISRSISPLAITSSLEKEKEKEEAESVEEKEAVYPKSGRPKLPWPILEDEPAYSVDMSVNIFNYDCGLCVFLFLSPRLVRADTRLRSLPARNTPTSPASLTRQPAPPSTPSTTGTRASSTNPGTRSRRTSRSRSAGPRRTTGG